MRFEPGKQFPPEIVDSVSKSMAALIDSTSYEIQLKGNRAAVRGADSLSLSDFDGAMVTVIDAKSKRYSTVSAQEYQRAFREWRDRAMPKAAAATSEGGTFSMRIDSPVKATGLTKKVQGIEVEEQQFTLAATVPGSDMPPMRIVFSLWTPTQAEKVRNAGLLERQRYAERAYVSSDFKEDVLKMLDTAMPVKGLRELLAVLENNDPLEMSMAYRMALPDTDPALPIMRLTLELTEFSTAEIPESAFAIPRDYIPSRVEEVLPASLQESRPARGVKAPVMQPGTEDIDPPPADPDRPKLQRRKP